ncbi:MAG: DUF1893 domain-containing protein [Lachnospiraceae bacterium]|nr:DUF1893 domain-containing protein [Lachnospiraceae bacterium]
MSDLQIAMEHLDGHSICLCKDGAWFTDDGRGISPMMQLIGAGRELSGYAVADLVVGKAAAMLFVKAGITSVYGRTMSATGKEYLERHGILCSCDTLTEKIINRQNTDICPMEKTVADLDDADDGYEALRAKINAMKIRRE